MTISNPSNVNIFVVGSAQDLENFLEDKANVDHTHEIADVEGLQDALDSKLSSDDLETSEQAILEVTARKTDVEGLENAIALKANTDHTHQPSDIEGLEDAIASKAEIDHTHQPSDIEGLENAIALKADASHTHQIDDVEGLGDAIAQKADASHTHQTFEVEGLQQELAILADAIASKAEIDHTHQPSDIEGLESTLADFPTSQDFLNLDAAIGEKASIEDLALNTLRIAALENEITEKVSQAELSSDLAELYISIQGKANTSHTHQISDVEELEDILNTKAEASHFHPELISSSSSPPSNPVSGQIWIETFPDQMMWMWYSGTGWVSVQEYEYIHESPTTSASANNSFGFPISPNYRYWISTIGYHALFSSGTINTTNYWRIIWSLQNPAQNFVDILITENNNDASTYLYSGLIIDPVSSQKILLMINRVGSPPAARIGTSIKYRRVRK